MQCDPCGKELDEKERYFKAMNNEQDKKAEANIICEGCIIDAFKCLDEHE